MTYLLYIIVGLFVVVLQTTLPMYFGIFEGLYDFFLLGVVYLGFYRPIREGLPFVILFGFVMDGMSGGPFGLYLSCYFWLYVGLLLLTRFMRVSNNLVLPLVVVGCVFIQNLIFLVTMALFIPEVRVPSLSYQRVVIQLLWAVVTGPVLILFFRGWHQTMEKWLKTFEPEYR